MRRNKISFDQIVTSTKQIHHSPSPPNCKLGIPSFVHSLQNHLVAHPLAYPCEIILDPAKHPLQIDTHQLVYLLLQSPHFYGHNQLLLITVNANDIERIRKMQLLHRSLT